MIAAYGMKLAKEIPELESIIFKRCLSTENLQLGIVFGFQ